MGLSWDVNKVADCETTCFYRAEEDDPMGSHKKGDRLLKSVTEAIIFLTVPVGINRLTKKNAETFYARAYAIERFGAFRSRKGEPVYVEPEDIVAHVGLATNASPKTGAAFNATLGRIGAEHARHAFRALREEGPRRFCPEHDYQPHGPGFCCPRLQPSQNDAAAACQPGTVKP